MFLSTHFALLVLLVSVFAPLCPSRPLDAVLPLRGATQFPQIS